MDVNDLHRLDENNARYFIWHEFIQASGPLTPQSAYEYFTHSQFYDKQSNNQVLRMQTLYTDTGMTLENEAEELRRFTGIEFALTYAQPPTFFIIQKRHRSSPDQVTPLAAYFIVNNRIYQAPDLYSVLSNHLLSSLSALQQSLDILRTHRPDYTPRTGFVWPVVGDPTPDAEASKKNLPPPEDAAAEGAKAPETEPTAPGDMAAPETSTSGDAKKTGLPSFNSNRRVNTMLLLNAMRTTHMNSQIAPPPSGAPPVAESVTAETPSTSQVRSSVTPAPSAQEISIKGTQGESSKPGGKKKRKRSVPNVALATTS